MNAVTEHLFAFSTSHRYVVRCSSPKIYRNLISERKQRGSKQTRKQAGHTDAVSHLDSGGSTTDSHWARETSTASQNPQRA